VVRLPEHLAKGPVGRERLPQEVLSEHQRDRILDGAIDVFAKRGYQAATIDNIVDASKSSVGSFYVLFEGKGDCMLRCYDRIVEDARARLLEAAPAGSPWAERVSAGLWELLTLIAEQPLAAKVALVEVQTAGEPALRRYEETSQEAVAFLRRGREEKASAEALPPALELVTASGITWLLHQYLVGGRAAEVTSLHAELTDLVLSPYVGEKKAARLIAATAQA
jgi:AcrR family transcriptional regulator